MAISPAMYWAQQVAVAPLLAVLILLLSLIPARHVLLPFWPDRVDELIVLAADGQTAVRRLSMGDAEDLVEEQVVARSRPLSVAVIEDRQGRLTLGFPVGVQGATEDGELGALEVLPDSWRASDLVLEDGSSNQLVLFDANDAIQVLPLTGVQRLYYPNQLDWMARIGVLCQRVRHCWVGGCPAPRVSELHSGAIAD